MSDGLEGVVAAETVLSEVDGAAGVLIIRGHSLDELAGRTTYEEVVALLFGGFYPDLPADLPAALGAARAEVFAEVSALDTGLLDRTPIEAMRALTARVADGDDMQTALRLLAAPAVFTAAVVRAQAGEAPVAPDPSLSHAADILRMLRGAPASKAEADALDTYLVTVADHGLNASTFAARVVASTRAGLGSAVLAGISALKGPLHGGAPGPVIEMLDEIGEPANARAWIEAALARGDRLMGFGHRIYKVRDPRADALKTAVRWLDARQGRLEFAEAVEAAALSILREHKPNRSLETNVEFYTALLLEALHFPPSAFTCVFAMGRVAGWLAHAREQLAGGRLIRPASIYVGPMPKKAA
ncbi:MAG: citrate synthase/methylcitrate synthase [Alphaproteobacteria bacterium]|nr:citrate synthase/methylcitrate synthase [Alphaproteobacteria bacterium]MBU1517070.1 citrate synthase/methylcitrate synthase [Alphaproteobacteria bacterium]MBU2093689.1 citrate synthase/methylcitrate synthase [Alphaproteobacteria bacterium]MBU2153989.1 citrate synthase/methylcitrate synthase [Alphaproteobacteria bacterium]MBU2308711.1 citrate synthase/methylcitrate synthase [Alphaproteobacteria bacterium]